VKLRSLILLGAGIAIGLSVSRKLKEDDPNVVTGPAESHVPANPALRAVSAGAQRIADRASVAARPGSRGVGERGNVLSNSLKLELSITVYAPWT